MDIIVELVVAVILGALGLGGPLNSRLKSVIGISIIELINPKYKAPAPTPVIIPSLADYMSKLGEYTLVEEEVFKQKLKENPSGINKKELVPAKGKAAMVVMYTLDNGSLALSVRWPSGLYYYLEEDTV